MTNPETTESTLVVKACNRFRELYEKQQQRKKGKDKWESEGLQPTSVHFALIELMQEVYQDLLGNSTRNDHLFRAQNVVYDRILPLYNRMEVEARKGYDPDSVDRALVQALGEVYDNPSRKYPVKP